MGRKINPFDIKISGKGTDLSVNYHFKGIRRGQTEFIVCNDGDEVASFTLNSDEDALALCDYIRSEINHTPAGAANAPSFETAGIMVKVMSHVSEIKTLCNPAFVDDNLDSITLSSLRKAMPEYDSDDYFFVVYTLKNNVARETVEAVIDACIEYQKAVIVSGDLKTCRSMGQKDIENQTGMDISTVSRASKNVRIYTPYRNYSLNSHGTSLNFPSLFNEGINGESSFGIREKIMAFVEVEDKRNPLTDDEIKGKLDALGYEIARRTVVKYRLGMGIPNSNKRKIR